MKCDYVMAKPRLLELRVLVYYYTTSFQGIIFVVDSNDRERLGEAREELERMLQEEDLRDAILLVFANKMDLPDAINVGGVADSLNLSSMKLRKVCVSFFDLVTLI